MKQKWIRLSVFFLVLGLGAASVSQAVAQPAQHSVLIRSGHMGRYEWSVFVEPAEEEVERQSGFVCLSISMLEPLGGRRAEGNSVTGCAKPPEGRPYLEHLRGGRMGKSRTVLAVLFPQTVTRARFFMRGQRGRTMPVGHVSLSDGTRYGFAVFDSIHPICLNRIVGTDASGRVVSTAGRQACV